MEYAAKVLIVGGMLNLAYAAITGLLISRVRTASPTVPRHLTLAHVGPLMQGSMLLALVIAFSLSTLPNGLEGFTAWLFVAGSLLVAAGDTLLWLDKTVDSFADRPVGFYLQASGGPLIAVAIAITLIGVLKGL
jgi:hypothetical protein